MKKKTISWKQIPFSFFGPTRTSFGGSELVGKRKTLRPLSTKRPIHLILKSDGYRIFAPKNERLEKLIARMANKFNITIQLQAVNWTHIHFLIKIKSRQDYNRFIRGLTSRLAMAVRKVAAKIFTLRPFTRIVSYGRDPANVLQYIQENIFQSLNMKLNRPCIWNPLPAAGRVSFRFKY